MMRKTALSGRMKPVTCASEPCLRALFLTGLWASRLKQKAVAQLTEVLEGVSPANRP